MAITTEATGLKLNMGSGQNPMPGYVNVDKFGAPDLKADLEVFPWPWETSSVSEVVFHHVLEHLGASTETYLGLIQELYRVCKPNAPVYITVPHPRHNNFLFDPTHVRPVVPESFMLFSQSKNRDWNDKGIAASPLGLYLDVDFEVSDIQYKLDPLWERMHPNQVNGERSLELLMAMQHSYNVIEEVKFTARAIKPTS